MTELASKSENLPNVPSGIAMRGTSVPRHTHSIPTSDQTRVTRDTTDGLHLTITGNEVIFESYKNKKDLSDFDATLESATDLKRLTIIADTIRIKRDMKLPGVNVDIYARVLQIEKDMGITTHPPCLPEDKEKDSTSGEPGKDGDKGIRGGKINLFVGTLDYLRSSHWHLFSTQGGTGQAPGRGLAGLHGNVNYGWAADENRTVAGTSEDGDPERIRTALNADDVEILKSKAVDPSFTIVKLKLLNLHREPDSPTGSSEELQGDWHPNSPPGNGGDAFSAAGVPGSGGNGGDISFWKSMKHPEFGAFSKADRVNVSAGVNADPRDTEGGKAGYAVLPEFKAMIDTENGKVKEGFNPPQAEARRYILRKKPGKNWFRSTHVGNWDLWVKVKYSGGKAKPGPKVAGSGTSGNFEGVSRQSGWFHKAHLSIYRNHLEQAFLSNTRVSIHAWARDLLDAIKPILQDPDFANGDDADSIALQVLIKYLNGILLKLAARQDSYGNPDAWAPATSLAAELETYQSSVDWALQASFAAGYFDHLDESLKSRVSGASRAITASRNARKKAGEELSEMAKEASHLRAEAKQCNEDLASLNKTLADLKVELRKEIKTKVVLQHAFSFVGTVMKVIPVYQPALGMVGGAISSGSELISKPPGEISGSENLGKILSFASDAGKTGLSSRLESLNKEVSSADTKASNLEGKKYLSDGRQKLYDNDQKAATEIREGVASQRKQAKTLSKFSTDFSDNAESMINDLKGAFYPKQEVDNLLAKFEAGDTRCVSVARQIKAHKEQLGRLVPKLVSLLAGMNRIQALIAAAHDHEADMYEELISATEREFPAGVRAFGDSMAAMAISDLIKERYLLIKSYENLFFESLTPDNLQDDQGNSVQPLDISAMLKAVKVNVAAAQNSENPDNKTMWSPEREKDVYDTYAAAMRPLLANISHQIGKAILDKARSGRSSLILDGKRDVKVTLDDLHCAAMNKSPTYQAFADLTRTSSLDVLRDRLVIETIDIADIQFEDPGNDAVVDRQPTVWITHNGEGIMKSRNTLYKVRYGHGAHVQSWNYQFDVSNPAQPKLINSNAHDREEAQNALLAAAQKAFSGGDDSDVTSTADFFTKLPAFSELAFRIEAARGKIPPKITKLELSLGVNSMDDQNTTLALDISTDEAIHPDKVNLPYPVQLSFDGGKSWDRYSLPLFVPAKDGVDAQIKATNLGDDGVVELLLAGEKPIPINDDGSWTLPMHQTNSSSTVLTLKALIAKVEPEELPYPLKEP